MSTPSIWLKLAPSVYSSLQASYCFQPHDPATEGFVMAHSDGTRQAHPDGRSVGRRLLLFANTSRLCPQGHPTEEVHSGPVDPRAPVFRRTCDHCAMVIHHSESALHCEDCEYDICRQCAEWQSAATGVSFALRPPGGRLQAGDNVELQPSDTGMQWCLGAPQQGLVGVVEGDCTNQGSLAVRCMDPRSRNPGTHFYSATQLRLTTRGQ
jgi:hypothetical protein